MSATVTRNLWTSASSNRISLNIRAEKRIYSLKLRHSTDKTQRNLWIAYRSKTSKYCKCKTTIIGNKVSNTFTSGSISRHFATDLKISSNCIKNFCIRICSGLYSVRMRENTDQKNCKNWWWLSISRNNTWEEVFPRRRNNVK